MTNKVISFDMRAAAKAAARPTLTAVRRVKPQAADAQAVAEAPAGPAAQPGKPPAKPVVRLTQAKPVAAPAPAPPAEAAARPAPEPLAPAAAEAPAAPRPGSRLPARIRARAELAAALAGWQGCDLAVGDILDHLAQTQGAEVTAGLKDLAAALRAHGLRAELTATAPATLSANWPALAQMTNGQLVLVLEQAGDRLTIFDPTQPDHRAEVSMGEFGPYFAHRILRIRQSVDQLTRTHAGTGKAPHWFWGEFLHHRRVFSEIVLGSFVANLLAVSVALFSLQVYDRVIPHQSEATLWVLALGAALALAMEAFLKVARARLMDSAGRRIEISVQARLMDRLLGMKHGPRGTPPSTLFQAMREFGSVREFFTASTVGTVADLPFILLFLLLVWSIGGPIVWVLVLGGVLMVVPGLLMQKRMMRLTRETHGAAARSARLLHEAIFEAETVRSQRGEDRVKRIWSELSALSSLKSSDQRKLASVLTFWAQGVQQATYVGCVVIGAYMVFAGEFTVGTIIAIGILTGRTLSPLAQLAATLSRWSNVKTALDGLEAIAGADQVEEDGRSYLRRDRLSGAWSINGLSFRYDTQAAPCVDVPALAVQAGQKIAVLGPNGSGKSTFLKLLAGLYTPDEGRVMLDGLEMAQIHPRDLRRDIGYLGQEVRLFSGTLRDNLNLTQLERDDARLIAALDFAGLGPFVKGHPKGLDMEIRDGGEGLSVGQRQSIGWARIWLQDPPVVLLDEPTAALDQTLEATLVSRLSGWLAARTAVIATHRVPILSLTDRVLILQNGRLAVDGPRDAVLAHLSKGPAAEAPGNAVKAG